MGHMYVDYVMAYIIIPFQNPLLHGLASTAFLFTSI